jgi:hypothetical protein
MKKILLSLAATAALAAAAAPAAAQPWRGHDDVHGQMTTSYVDGLQWKIDNAVRERRISWNEARELKAELRQAQPIAWRVQTGQAGYRERQRLDRIVSRIESAVNRYAMNERGRGWRR